MGLAISIIRIIQFIEDLIEAENDVMISKKGRILRAIIGL